MTWTCPCSFPIPIRRDASTCYCGGAFVVRTPPPEPTTPILPTEELARITSTYDGLTYQEAKQQVLRQLVGDYFPALLDRCCGNLSAAERESGVQRAHIRQHMKALGLR